MPDVNDFFKDGPVIVLAQLLFLEQFQYPSTGFGFRFHVQITRMMMVSTGRGYRT